MAIETLRPLLLLSFYSYSYSSSYPTFIVALALALDGGFRGCLRLLLSATDGQHQMFVLLSLCQPLLLSLSFMHNC